MPSPDCIRVWLRLCALALIGVQGTIATVYCGLIALANGDVPAVLAGISIGAITGISGWLTQPNGRSDNPSQGQGA